MILSSNESEMQVIARFLETANSMSSHVAGWITFVNQENMNDWGEKLG